MWDLIPLVVRVLSWLLDRRMTSEKTAKAMSSLIASLKDEGLLPIQHADKLQAHHNAILDQIQKDREKSQG